MAKNMVVKSKVQEMAKKLGVRLSGEAVASIEHRVESTLKKAAERAKANKRKTILPHDF
jgi:histone H3/H4